MARKVAKQTTVKIEGEQSPSISITYRFVKDIDGELNGRKIKHATGDIVELSPIEAFVYRDWLEKI